MLTLFKSLVLSRLNYGSQLWSPDLVKHIDQLEKIPRSFTKHITGMQSLDLQWTSCLFKASFPPKEMWTILYYICVEDNRGDWLLTSPIQSFVHTQIIEVDLCIVSHVHVVRLGTLAFNSFRWQAIHLLNSMPNHIRWISSCSVLSFKCKFDLYLKNIVNFPGRPGFNNSLDSVNYKQW